MEIRPNAQQALPPVVKNILIINGIFFVATEFAASALPFNIVEQFALFYVESPFFRPWQFVTHMFMHGGFSHIFFNMFALWMFGSIIEQRFGAKRFLIFYFICGLGAAACHMAVQGYLYHSTGNIGILQTPTVGASGAVYGLLFAFGYLWPNAVLHLYFAIPVKAKYVVIGLAAIGLFSGISNNPGDNVAHFAHLGGMLAGFLAFKAWNIRYNAG